MLKRWMALVVGLAACSANEPAPVNVKSIDASAAAVAIAVGGTTQATAVVTGVDDKVIAGAHVSWSSVTPTIVSVSSTGLVTGLSAGTGAVRATAGGKTADVAINVQNPPAASAAFDKDSAVILLPSGTLTLVPVVKDASGKVIPNPTMFYSTDAPRVATVSLLGVVTAVAAGTATISGVIDGQTARIKIRVGVNASGTAPKVTTVSALTAGGNATISGSGFAASTSGNAVLIEGVAATVTAATTTQLSVTLPAGGWGCETSRSVAVQVTANNETGVGQGTLRIANSRTLAVGQSLVVTSPAEVRCNELVGGGTYLVSVYNTSRTVANNAVPFVLRGAQSAGTVAADALIAATRATASRRSTARPALWPSLGALSTSTREEATHADVMQRSIDFARAAGSPRDAIRRWRATTDGAVATATRANQVTTAGAITTVKVPNLDAANFCATSISIGARTAWVGAHAVIVEDTIGTLDGKATLRGQLDSLYAVVGNEFEATMWPLLTANFGNPLAMDAQLSRTGKLVMVFSPRINAMAGGTVAGFVVSCDFFPVSQSASSNFGEYFYAIVPTNPAAGISAGTKDSWMRQIRSTIIHEVKHITAFGERFSRNTDFEELWLEEGTARHAEELYARGIYGAAWKGNVTYQNSVFCDVRPAAPSAPQCAGRPILMLRHFDGLYQYLQSPEPFTMLGRTSATDATFYATSWSMVRWIADQYATNESQFLQSIIQSPVTGVANLEARSGRPWEELFGEWSLMLYADDLAGLTTANTRLRFPSWNLRSQFLGMCGDFGPCTAPNPIQNFYPTAFPEQPRALSFGSFSDTTGFLNAGSFSRRLLTGAAGASQLLDLRGLQGGDPPSNLRIAILRIQ